MKRNLTRFGSLALVLTVLVVLLAPCAQAAELDTQCKNGVVYLSQSVILNWEQSWSSTSGTEVSSWNGTAFFVGLPGEKPQYLVTAYQNVKLVQEALLKGKYHDKTYSKDMDYTASRIDVWYDDQDHEQAFVVAYDELKDLAILRLEAPTDKRIGLYLRETEEDLDSSEIFALGFPAAGEQSVDAVHVAKLSDMILTSGVVNRLVTESGTGRTLVQTDAAINGSSSGGPLVNALGSVIGCNVCDLDEQNKMVYAIGCADILPLLKANSISFCTEEEVLAAAQAETEAPTETEPVQEEETSNVMKIALPVGAVVIIVAGICIALAVSSRNSRKKKEAQEKAAREEAERARRAAAATPEARNIPRPAAPEKKRSNVNVRPILKSLEAQHNGLSVPVGTDPVLVGRDRTVCRFAFDDKTPGVSARHCSVAYDANKGQFLLTDVGSTYGTYLASGQRLTTGVVYRLNPGETFYLGEKQNILRVELG